MFISNNKIVKFNLLRFFFTFDKNVKKKKVSLKSVVIGTFEDQGRWSANFKKIEMIEFLPNSELKYQKTLFHGPLKIIFN